MLLNTVILLLAPILVTAAEWCTINFRHVQKCPPEGQVDFGDTYRGFYATGFEWFRGQQALDIRWLDLSTNSWHNIDKNNNIGLPAFPVSESSGQPGYTAGQLQTMAGYITLTVLKGNPWTVQFDGLHDRIWTTNDDDGGTGSSHTSGAKAWCTSQAGWTGLMGNAPDGESDAQAYARLLESEGCKQAKMSECDKDKNSVLCQLAKGHSMRVSLDSVLRTSSEDWSADLWKLGTPIVLPIHLRLRLQVGLVRV
jgi:hypothetical protein